MLFVTVVSVLRVVEVVVEVFILADEFHFADGAAGLVLIVAPGNRDFDSVRPDDKQRRDEDTKGDAGRL